MEVTPNKRFFLIFTNFWTFLIVAFTISFIYYTLRATPPQPIFVGHAAQPIGKSQILTDAKLMIAAYLFLLVASGILYRKRPAPGYKSTAVALFVSFLNLSLSLLFAVTILGYLLNT